MEWEIASILRDGSWQSISGARFDAPELTAGAKRHARTVVAGRFEISALRPWRKSAGVSRVTFAQANPLI